MTIKKVYEIHTSPSDESQRVCDRRGPIPNTTNYLF